MVGEALENVDFTMGIPHDLDLLVGGDWNMNLIVPFSWE